MEQEVSKKENEGDIGLEREAEAAFANITKQQSSNDEFEDEFSEAFNTAQNSFSNGLPKSKAKEETSELSRKSEVVAKSKTESDDIDKNLKSGQQQCETPAKVAVGSSDDLKTKSMEGSPVPPLPEFALELITRQKSGEHNDLLSPTQSIRSNESSERGWSSDPDSYRVKPQQSLEEAKEEWDQVGTVTAGATSHLSKSPMMTFSEAIFYFKSANLDEYAASIKPTIKHSGLSAVWYAMTGPPKIHERLRKDRDLIFTTALCPFDNLEAMHLMILQTIYKKLTATNLDCPRYGSHWESIGFQGVDPATDLRGCGMLGLLTTLNLVSSPETHSLAIDIYRLSEDEIQNFPFCVMAINITRISLQIFREGKLNKECNKRVQVFEVFNELFCSIYHRIYRIWKLQHKTITDSGFVINEVETAAKKNPVLMMTNFHKTMSERKKTKVPIDRSASSKHGSAPIERIDKFKGVCDIVSNEDEEVHLV